MRYEPWDPAVMADPYPSYAWLREEQRCYFNEEHNFYALSRYEDVAPGLRNPGDLASGDGVSVFKSAPGLVLVGEDPPTHTDNRRVAARAFTPRAMTKRSAEVADNVQKLVGNAIDRGEVDAVHDIATPLAVASLADALGIPDPDLEAWLAMATETFENISAKQLDSAIVGPTEKQLAVAIPIDTEVEARKRSGEPPSREDIVDAVVAAAEPNAQGFRLTRAGRATFVTAMVGPGLETTRHLIGSAFDLIARYPDRWQRVRSGEVAPAMFVEEVLRYESPVQGFFRTATAPISVGDEEIPAGARVLMLFGAANRDPRVFSDGDAFIPGRGEKDHLAFGAGIHYCLGAGLARLEVTELFANLARRVTSVEPAGEPVRTPHALLRGFDSLPVRLVV